MKEKVEEKSKVDILNSEAFSDLDVCEMSIELFHDILFHNNPDFIRKSIEASGLAEKLFEIMINEEFKNHPLRNFFNQNVEDFDDKKLKVFIATRYREIPGVSLFVMKHDDKRATVFVTAQIYAAVGQLKKINEEFLKPWMISVQTDVGFFSIN